jgi:hypothetical protein
MGLSFTNTEASDVTQRHNPKQGQSPLFWIKINIIAAANSSW